MEFLNPWAWCLALAVLPVIVFFFLKTRLRDTTVATSLFWDEIIEEQRVRAFGYRFRYPAALILSLLFLGCVIGAALDPIFLSQKNAARTVIVFDPSASMNAVDRHGKTCFALAKAELLKAIDRMESGRTTAIITAGAEPEIAVGFTDHRPTLRETVQNLQQTNDTASLVRAVDVAKILTQNADDTRILVFTDGCSPEIDTLKNDNSVTVFQVGKSLDNVALTRFQVRRSMVEAVGFDVFAEVSNFSDKNVQLRLTLELHGGETNPENNTATIDTLDIIPISLEAGATETVISHGHTELGGTVIGSLTIEKNDSGKGEKEFHDALESDNAAHVSLPEKTKFKILFFGEDDYFLRKVLESQLNVNIETITQCPETIDANTLLVIHKMVPQVIPGGSVLIVDPKNDCDLFSVGDAIDAPIIATEDEDSPLLKFVRLDGVAVQGVRHLNFLSENRPDILLATPENDAILLRWNETIDSRTKKESRKIVLLCADLSRGDLALRTAFPILISNAISDFRHDTEWQKEGFSHAINAPVESDLRKRSGDTEVHGIFVLKSFSHSIRFWFVVAAILVLILDWFLYHRRWVE